MVKNYLKIALRIIKKQMGYSLVNILGLGIGIACCLMIVLFVRDEISYDRFHENADRIFRVVASTSEDRMPTNANGCLGWGPALKQSYPEVVETVRIRKMGQGVNRYVGYQEKKFYEDKFFFCEPAIFTMFNFPLVRGNPETALSEPNTIVLTEETARKYFSGEDPIGKVLEADPYNTGELMHFRVTGIAKNVPANSHLHFNFLASYISQKEDLNSFSGFWQHYTYILLDRETSAAVLEPRLYEFLERHFEKDPWYTISLQPLLDIHLYSRLRSEVEPVGDINTIHIFSVISLLVLVIACINFINLTTARSLRRAREVGLRKVVGARRGQLIRQHLSEATTFSLLGVITAAILTALLIRFFNAMTEKQVSLNFLYDPFILLVLVGLTLAVGLAAGMYPAFFLSSFRPVTMMKSGSTPNTEGVILRKGLVTLQFTLSIGLFIAMLISFRQMEYIRSRHPGYDKEQILVIPLNKDIRSGYESLRNELLGYPGIENTTTSSYVPTRGSAHLGFQIEGCEERLSQVVYLIDKEFIDTYGLRIQAGKPVEKMLSQGSEGEFLISESTAREAGYDSPLDAVGKVVSLQYYNFKGLITGVVNDMNIYSLHVPVYSIMYFVTPIESHKYLSIRLDPEHISSSLRHISQVWSKRVPNYPITYFFLDASFEQMHRADQKMKDVFTVFSVLAMFVGCLGLFGLAAHTAEQRVKEFGIRKVLGASIANILVLLSMEFLKWVVIANVIAWPLAYYFMNKWLQNFVYRIDMAYDCFILSGFMALFVALVTIGFQITRVARTNPVDTLRYE